MSIIQELSAPDGYAGTAKTIKEMWRFVNQSAKDGKFVRLATDIARSAPAKDYRAEANAIYTWVKSYIRYTRDPHGMEMVQDPWVTLDRRAGDCDDQVVLVAALSTAIGLPSRFRTVKTFEPDNFSHIYTQVFAGGRWLGADTTEPHYLGWESPARYGEQIWNNPLFDNGISGLGLVAFRKTAPVATQEKIRQAAYAKSWATAGPTEDANVRIYSRKGDYIVFNPATKSYSISAVMPDSLKLIRAKKEAERLAAEKAKSDALAAEKSRANAEAAARAVAPVAVAVAREQVSAGVPVEVAIKSASGQVAVASAPIVAVQSTPVSPVAVSLAVSSAQSSINAGVAPETAISRAVDKVVAATPVSTPAPAPKAVAPAPKVTRRWGRFIPKPAPAPIPVVKPAVVSAAVSSAKSAIAAGVAPEIAISQAVDKAVAATPVPAPAPKPEPVPEPKPIPAPVISPVVNAVHVAVASGVPRETAIQTMSTEAAKTLINNEIENVTKPAANLAIGLIKTGTPVNQAVSAATDVAVKAVNEKVGVPESKTNYVTYAVGGALIFFGVIGMALSKGGR